MKNMKEIQIFLVFLTLLFIGCNNSDNIDKLIEQQKEIESLKTENNNLKSKSLVLEKTLDSINLKIKNKSKADKSVKIPVNTSQATGKYYSEAEAIDYVKDYYNFYNADYIVKNIRVRRIANNKFHVSLEEMSKRIYEMEKSMNSLKGADVVALESNNYILTISNNKEYTLIRQF
jgi:hypothetical protein